MRRRARPGGGRQLEVEIEALGAQGDGIAQIDGRPVFVPLVLPGERAVVRLIGERAAGYRAQVVELLRESPVRQAPPCPHFGPCGGCTLQHLPRDHYLEFKLKQVSQALRRVGLEKTPVAEMHAVPPSSRRRATLAVRRRDAGFDFGFHGRQSHDIVDLKTCLVVTPAILSALPYLRSGLLLCLSERETAEVTLTETRTGLDVLLRSRREPGLEARQSLAGAAEAAGVARLSWAPPKGESEPIVQRHPPEIEFGGVTVTPGPGGFLQPTSQGEEFLVQRILAYLPETAERVADLYAGCGSFTFPLATRTQVLAVEGDEAALANLWQAARRAGLAGRVVSDARDLARYPLRPEELAPLDAVVFDPPRAGAKAQAEALAQSPVPTVIAVSCNPNTFARDARTLVDGGYRLVEVRPLDQFVWSGHVELIALFRRDNPGRHGTGV